MRSERDQYVGTDDVGVAGVLKRTVIGIVVLVGALSLLGGVGSLLVFDGALGDAEADVVSWVAEHRIGVLDSAATIVSTWSDTWTVVGVVIGAVTMLWAAGHGRHAATVLLAVLIEFVSFLAIGALIGRPRPDVEALHSVPSTPSFPSGHTAAALVLYGSLALVARSLRSESVPRWVWAGPIVIALAVAASRVYEGVHHPTDVAAGLLLGTGALAAAAHATGIIDVTRWVGAWGGQRSGRSEPSNTQ